MKNRFQVIKRPILTERSNSLRADKQQVVFAVHPKANKLEIKKALETIFKIRVLAVNTQNYKGKPKRLGVHQGKRSAWKKAIVTVPKGEKLDFLEG